MRTYIHYGHKVFDSSIFSGIKNIPLSTKPSGGLWASDTKAVRGWKDWCESEEFRECSSDNAFEFVLKKEARILCIKSIDDLEPLPKYKGSSPISWVLLDFESLAEQYDAMEVIVSESIDLYFALYGWDCDSILVFNSDAIKTIPDFTS